MGLMGIVPARKRFAVAVACASMVFPVLAARAGASDEPGAPLVPPATTSPSTAATTTSTTTTTTQPAPSATPATVATTTSPPRPAVAPDTPVSRSGAVGAPPGTSSTATAGWGESLGAGSRHDDERTEEPPRVAPTPMGTSSIIGVDTRRAVTNTRVAPYRHAVWIVGRTGRSSYSCSGSMISANTVATAGHCVYDPADGWATSVRVYPARNGVSAPFGSCGAKDLYSVSAWTKSADDSYDYGAIKLSCSIGTKTGWFGMATAQSIGSATSIVGYPGDRPLGTQAVSSGSVRYLMSEKTFYTNDTSGGMSGAGVWRTILPFGRLLVAIHGYGVGYGYPYSSYNHGKRLTPTALANYKRWRSL